MMDKTYFKGIDGLRAVAVIIVVLFHLGVDGFDGGYIGVDIFFVISGFLISRIIITNKQSKTFSFSDFYLRRARRLLPALLFTYFICSIAALTLFSYDLVNEYLYSLYSSIFFSSNIYFYSISGYFDSATLLKPLLHTWSLSVEEQFYFFWPFTLTIFFKQLKKPKVYLLLILSFTLISQFLILIDQEFGFYMTFSRIHEFLLGTFTYLTLTKIKSTHLKSLSCVLGVSFLAIPVFSFNSNTSFPGIMALIPSIGAVLCLYGLDSKLSQILLENNLMRFFGKISYSFYLIHWPIIVFYLYHQGKEVLNTSEQSVVFIFSTSIAYVMYRWIENPFRAIQKNNKRFLITLSIFLLTLIVSGIYLQSKGINLNLSNSKEINNLKLSHKNASLLRQAKIRAPKCHHNDESESWESYISRFDQCNTIKKESVLIFGDSHAADLWLALSENSNKNIIQITAAACQKNRKLTRCNQMYNFISHILLKHPQKIEKIIFTQRSKKLDKLTITNILNFLSELKTLNNEVIWVGPQIEYYPTIPSILKESNDINDFVIRSTAAQKSEIFALDKTIQNEARRYNIKYISKLQTLCERQVCPILKDNHILYEKRSHWSIYGSLYFGKQLSDALKL